MEEVIRKTTGEKGFRLSLKIPFETIINLFKRKGKKHENISTESADSNNYTGR